MFNNTFCRKSWIPLVQVIQIPVLALLSSQLLSLNVIFGVEKNALSKNFGIIFEFGREF